jgi:hypothetical protein
MVGVISGGMFAGLVVASLQFVLGQSKGHFTEGTLLYELSELKISTCSQLF